MIRTADHLKPTYGENVLLMRSNIFHSYCDICLSLQLIYSAFAGKQYAADGTTIAMAMYTRTFMLVSADNCMAVPQI